MSFLKEGNLLAKFFIKAAIPKQAFFLNKNEIFSEQILFLIFIGSAPGSRPARAGRYADLSRYPGRRGFEDIAQIVNQDRQDFAWSAAAFPKERPCFP